MAAAAVQSRSCEMPKGYYFGPQDPELAAKMGQANQEAVKLLSDWNKRLGERHNHVR